MAAVDVAATEFRHDPLDLTKHALRVVRLLPGSGDIRCEIEVTDISSKFTAVSYVWGDPEPVQSILINARPFQIQPNLYRFLVQARANNVLGPLWIDALCIDQRNAMERNHQVEQMGAIYRGAQRVISWLGEGNERMAQYLQAAGDIAKEVADKQAARRYTASRTSECTLFYLAMHQRRFTIPNFLDLVEKFCNLDYFSRTWIVQEMLLVRGSHIAMYGPHSLDWTELKEVTSRYIIQFANQLGTCLAVPFLASGKSPATRNEVITTIIQFAKTQCSDPRDHIYALRVLWQDTTYSIRVDYTKSRLELFVRVMSALFDSTVQRFSTIVTILDMLDLETGNFDDEAEAFASEDQTTIMLSVKRSREMDMQGLAEYRNTRSGWESYNFSDHRAAYRLDEHDFRLCTCQLCIQMPALPAVTVFREFALRRADHDPTMDLRMGVELYLVEIIGSKTYYGLVEGDLQDSDVFLLILPQCLNEPGETPRIQEKNGRLSVAMNLRRFCQLLSHLRPDQCLIDENNLSPRDGYWGWDCDKHDDPFIGNNPVVYSRGSTRGNNDFDRQFWGRRRWRSEMRQLQGLGPRHYP